MELKRILIANRGEIALRALRTIKEMGKEAVVVYSTADKDALYVNTPTWPSASVKSAQATAT